PGPDGPAGRNRPRGGVPGVGLRVLHHRRGADHGWRPVAGPGRVPGSTAGREGILTERTVHNSEWYVCFGPCTSRTGTPADWAISTAGMRSRSPVTKTIMSTLLRETREAISSEPPLLTAPTGTAPAVPPPPAARRARRRPGPRRARSGPPAG